MNKVAKSNKQYSIFVSQDVNRWTETLSAYLKVHTVSRMAFSNMCVSATHYLCDNLHAINI